MLFHIFRGDRAQQKVKYAMHVESKGILLNVAVQSHREAPKPNDNFIWFKLSQLLHLKRHTSTQFQMLKKKTPHTDIKIRGRKIRAMINTGASVNILDEKTFKTLCDPCKTDVTIFAYASQTPLPVLSQTYLKQSHDF